MSPLNPTRRSQRGFALVITLSLVALLILVLLALTSLVKVNSKATDTTLAQAKARQNALLALDIAMAQLQKHAGPDTRVTATGEAFGPAGAKYYTGVWDSAGTGPTPMTWLVSGSEGPGVDLPALLASAPDPTTDAAGSEIFLVGNGSVAVDPAAVTDLEKAMRLKVKKVQLTADVPGLGTVPAGNYAWWVGDLGVKASLGLPDMGEKVNYAPWDTAKQRRRIRQQIAGTPNYFRNIEGARYGFEPLTATALRNVLSTDQLVNMSLVSATGTTTPMSAFLKQHYHDFTVATYAVLSNTRSDDYRGLMRDLSLAPSELGGAFLAYSSFQAYMESPSDASRAIPKIADVDSPRRRYNMVPFISKPTAPGLPDATFSVAPVLSDFLFQFSAEPPLAAQIKLGFKIYVSLWNPYSAALVPDPKLYLDISGFPSTITVNTSTGGVATFNLPGDLPGAIVANNPDLGPVLRVFLPFDPTITRGSKGDRASWLPGRVYGWTTKAAADGEIDQNLRFYFKTIGSTQRWFSANKGATGANKGLMVTAPDVAAMKIQLRNDAGVLATYSLPRFKAAKATNNPEGTTTTTITRAAWFGYAARLFNPTVTDKDRSWLDLFDPRSPDMSANRFIGFDPALDADPRSLDPNLFSDSSPTTVHSDFLLYRVQGSAAAKEGVSAYNDVPSFELPRLPFLSVGELQHFQLTGKRPFSIGNSWGGTANGIFDRFFFSGIPQTGPSPDILAGQPLPNWNLRLVDSRRVTALPFTLGVIRDMDPATSLPNPFTSRFLLQAGGFNVNSLSQPAWRALLSGLRYGSGSPFVRANIDDSAGSDTLGTQLDPTVTPLSTADEPFKSDETLGLDLAAPTFSRFPQSAQETYSWAPNTSGDNPRQFPTDTFRFGVRGTSRSVAMTDTAKRDLTVDQTERLATQITTLLKNKQSKGPFRTLEDFLSFNVRTEKSLLEAAIDDSGINPRTITSANDSNFGSGFSSLTLTQADILTALAPYLRTRSDTFVVRTFGDAVNPATGITEAEARIEATVQRLPATVDAGDNLTQPTGSLGRQFKIISLRWLTQKDF